MIQIYPDVDSVGPSCRNWNLPESDPGMLMVIQDASPLCPPTAGPGICPSENHQKTIRSDLGNTRRDGLEEGNILFANGSVQASGVRPSARAIWKVQVILLLSHWDRIMDPGCAHPAACWLVWATELDTMQAGKDRKMIYGYEIIWISLISLNILVSKMPSNLLFILSRLNL